MKYIAYHYNKGDAKLDFSFQPDAALQLKLDFLAILLEAANDLKAEIDASNAPATAIVPTMSTRRNKATDPGEKMGDLTDDGFRAKFEAHNIAAPHNPETCPICVEHKKRGL